MNILFASYGDFYCSGSIHIFGFANRLAKLGHHCVVAVPSNQESVTNLGVAHFKALSFSEVNSGVALFENGAPPDIIQAWTPREVVRKFVEPLRHKWRCKLAVYLEEHEERRIEVTLQMPLNELLKLSLEDLNKLIPDTVSHPVRYKQFLASADGVNVIINKLLEFVPEGIAAHCIQPGVDFEQFKPLEKQEREREFPGLKPGSKVLAYTGQVHRANCEEVRNLYLALGELNRRNIPTQLLRTGSDQVTFLGPDEEWVRQYEVKLGQLNWSAIPRVLNAADVLIQPGRCDAFSAYKLPSKLPEFLAMGRPVLLPKCNLGDYMDDGQHAILLHTGCAQEITACVQRLFQYPQLSERLKFMGREFARSNFKWELAGSKMAQFYEKLLDPNSEAANKSYSNLEGVSVPYFDARTDMLATTQFEVLQDARWRAIVQAVLEMEEQLDKIRSDKSVELNFKERLHTVRATFSWRCMCLLRRMDGMLLRGKAGGWLGFFKWLFGAKTSLEFDPFDGSSK